MSTIELDCAPGAIRPRDLISIVLKGTGIVIAPENTIGRFFGNWTWEIPEEYNQQYKDNKELLKQRITDLYNAGYIRYGSW